MRIFSAVVNGESDVDELIQAALAHTKSLRQSANTGDDRGARVTEAEAERWERLAHAAQSTALALRSAPTV
jgi:catalase (peroxidase I)